MSNRLMGAYNKFGSAQRPILYLKDMSRCHKCNTVFDTLDDARFCPLCGAALDTTSPQPDASVHSGGTVVWEQMTGDTNLIQSFIATAGNILFRPRSFFKALQPDTRWWWPLLFALIASAISALSTFAWTRIWLSWLPDWLMRFEPYFQNQTVSSLLWSPAACIGGIFGGAVLLQATLVLFHRRQRNSFAMTIRMLSYMQSSALCSLIPFAGPAIGIVWWFCLLIAGLRSVHRMSTAKAVVLFIAPMIVLLIFITLAVIMVIAGGFFTVELLKDFITNFRY